MPIAKVNDLDLYYELHGSGDPLLLIGCTGLDHTAWDNQVPVFAKEFQCIVYDNRGTGRSSKPDSGYSTRAMADDAAGLLSAIGVDTAHIAGYSLGSAIAQELAINHPKKVKSLSLYATWDRPYPHFRRRFELQVELAKLERPEILTAFKTLTLFSPGYLNEHEEELGEREVINSSGRNAYPTPLHALLGHYEADISHNTTSRLAKISVPTLILVGANDPLTRPEYARAVHDAVPDSELVVLDDADHMMVTIMPDVFNEVALRFLGKCRSSR